MAFSATHVWEVRTDATAGDVNGGGFNPGNANMATDLAATVATGNSPVVTSASYTFVAGDVGAWVFIKSGTNWTPGWYQIASVAAGAATLSAAIGAAVLKGSATQREGPNTVAGCATVASPTSGTWTVDYSQQAAAQIAYTDMVIDGTTNTKYTSAANPVGKNIIGNTIKVISGTGFTVQRVEVVSTSGTTATCDKSLGTLGSTGGTGNLGGALLTIQAALTLATVDGMIVYVQAGAGYSISVALTFTAGGATQYFQRLLGYSTVRGDLGRASITVTAAVNGMTLATSWHVENFDINGTSTGLVGIAQTSYTATRNCKVYGFTGIGITGWTSSGVDQCEVTACVGGVNTGRAGTVFTNNWIHDNTGVGINVAAIDGVSIKGNLVVNNSGASSDGIQLNSASHYVEGNICYGNGRDGIRCVNQYSQQFGNIINNIFMNNAGYGIRGSASLLAPNIPSIDYNAFFNNTSGARLNINASPHDVTLTADPFTNAAGNDFSLNNVAGGGAACRNAGFPGALPGLATPLGYADIGVYRHQDPAQGPVLRGANL